MGSYGIGLERILVAAAELYHDDAGLVWPRAIAPFQVIITLIRPDDEVQRQTAEQFYMELNSRGVDCLLDDREKRPGAKFKDAELIGVPVRITLGKKIQDGIVELFSRRGKKVQEVSVNTAVDQVMVLLKSYPL